MDEASSGAEPGRPGCLYTGVDETWVDRFGLLFSVIFFSCFPSPGSRGEANPGPGIPARTILQTAGVNVN